MESDKCKTNVSMAGAGYQNALLCEQNQKNLLRELFEVKCNGDEAILDVLIEKSKKKLKEIRPHVEVLENALRFEQKKDERYLGFVLDVSKSVKGESVSVNYEDTKSGSINFQDDNLPENREATSVNAGLSNEITNTGCKKDKHPEIARENFDAVAGTMSSCSVTPQNTNDGGHQQISVEISRSQSTVTSEEQQVQSEIKTGQLSEGDTNTQMSTSKETARDVLSGILMLEEPPHEEVKAVLGSEVEHEATPGACDSNKDARISASLVDTDTKEPVDKLEKNVVYQADVATVVEDTVSKMTYLANKQLTCENGKSFDDKFRTMENKSEMRKQMDVAIPKTTDTKTNTTEQIRCYQPRRHNKVERRATAILDKHIVKNGSPDVEIGSEGCSLLSSEQTCSVKQNSDDVHSSRVETTSTLVSSAASPPGCEEHRFGCGDTESVMPAEQVLTSSHLSSNEQSNEHCVKDKSHVEVTQDDVNVACRKEFLNYQNKDDKMIATGSNMLSKSRHGEENDRSRKRDKNKAKTVKADKKRNRSKDEKAAERTKRFSHRFFSLFCFCFTRQERNNQNNETKQSTAEKTRTQDTSQISFVTIDLNY